MAKVYYDRDADLSLLKGKLIGIIGYGSQGHAHALNLRDSGCDVIVASKPGGTGWKAAAADGFKVMSVADATKKADILTLLAPDNQHATIYAESSSRTSRPQDADVRSRVQRPLLPDRAPQERRCQHGRSQGARPHDARHLQGECRTAGHHGRIPERVRQGERGCTRVRLRPGLRRRRRYRDYVRRGDRATFGEQTVLCGGVTALIKAGFDTLVEAGYQPEIAYFECLNELKLIVDLIYQGGMKYMRYSVSDVAEFGDYTRGPRVINDSVKAEMRKILKEIKDGSFALEWVLENQAGRPHFNSMKRNEQQELIEVVGEQLRGMMPWTKK